MALALPQMMYKMYRGFHHKKGNSAAAAALRKLPAVKVRVALSSTTRTGRPALHHAAVEVSVFLICYICCHRMI